LQLPIWNLEYFHLFLPIQSKAEIDTTLILTLLQGRDKQVILPKVSGTELEHILLTDSTVIRKNDWDIPEPDQGLVIQPKQLDVVFIPLLGYDKVGNRIGYGKGFYDSFLAACKPEVIKVGLSFFLPVEQIQGMRLEDMKLDYCVHPEGIIDFSDL
jgi:5-formyltetrahydrofolate cyclo-ligase